MKNKIKRYLILALVIIVVVVVAIKVALQPRKNAEIITAASLEKIIDVEELSTLQVRYDGVAIKYNEKNPDKVEYYVAYEATVKAGFEFDEVEIEVDHDAKEVHIILPEMKITDHTVKDSSLKYIFVVRRAETTEISNEAKELCVNDLKEESAKQTALIDLAKDNAVNTITALTEPFIKQVDAEYEVIVE